jgi:putative endonuclease
VSRLQIDRRRQAHDFGIKAEWAAILFLRLKGYRILASRYRVRGGEIDIIAGKAKTIAFVEVKFRPTLEEAACSIDAGKRRRLGKATRVWLAAHPGAARLCLRGDAIFLAPWRWPRHEIAAFELDCG